MRHNRYTVAKVGEHEGPQKISTFADYMKLWLQFYDSDEFDSEDEKTEKI